MSWAKNGDLPQCVSLFFPSLCFRSNDVNFHPESHEDSMNSWFLKKNLVKRQYFANVYL